ncbi:hypothetical protein ALHIDCOG_00086 [Klebsiella phage CPRSB]|nr:hypothetical protein ALHIDCOG_00086 [Klebsiella phage CPRSB]
MNMMKNAYYPVLFVWTNGEVKKIVNSKAPYYTVGEALRHAAEAIILLMPNPVMLVGTVLNGLLIPWTTTKKKEWSVILITYLVKWKLI